MHVSRHETHALDRPLARWKFERNLEKVDSIARHRRLLSALDTRTPPTPPHRPPSRGPGAVLQFRSEGRAARHNRRIVIEIQEEIKAACPRSLAMTKTVKWFSLPKSSLPQNYMEGI